MLEIIAILITAVTRHDVRTNLDRLPDTHLRRI